MKREIGTKVEKIVYIDRYFDGGVIVTEESGKEYLVTNEYVKEVYTQTYDELALVRREFVDIDKVDKKSRIIARFDKLKKKTWPVLALLILIIWLSLLFHTN